MIVPPARFFNLSVEGLRDEPEGKYWPSLIVNFHSPIGSGRKGTVDVLKHVTAGCNCLSPSCLAIGEVETDGIGHLRIAMSYVKEIPGHWTVPICSPERRSVGNCSSGTFRRRIGFLTGYQEDAMADDKSKRDNRDRSRVAGGEDYEVQYLAEQTGITAEQARTLIRRHGNNREKLMQEAKLIRS